MGQLAAMAAAGALFWVATRTRTRAVVLGVIALVAAVAATR